LGRPELVQDLESRLLHYGARKVFFVLFMPLSFSVWFALGLFCLHILGHKTSMSVICEDCGHLNWCHARFPAGTPSAQRAELADIQHQLEVLKARERDLEAALAIVAYPVLTLPPEITSHIFLNCLPFHGRVQPSATKAPLVLAQVCRHWRDVALATAGLWSSIDLKFELYGPRNIPDNGTILLSGHGFPAQSAAQSL
jgi:hypothetical protein